jgi:hypothetical protein
MLLMVLAFVAVVAPALVGAAPQAGRGSTAIGMIQYGSIEGRVAAVDLKTKTMQVVATEGSVAGPVNVALTDQTVIRQGMVHKKSSDIKVGEHVDITYAGSRDRWVADNVDILESSVAEAHYLGNGAR